MIQTYPYTPIPLNCKFSHFAPHLSEESMYLHYEKFYKNVVAQLNALMKMYPALQGFNLEELLTKDLQEVAGFAPTVDAQRILHYARSTYNHGLFFGGLNTNGAMIPQGNLKKAIEATYGNVPHFQQLFANAAENILGCGHVWLNSEGNGRIHISISTECQTPDLTIIKPIFITDVWEHAYFNQYSTEKKQYIKNWFAVLNWDLAEERFIASLTPSS